jgi:hypothetical protein
MMGSLEHLADGREGTLDSSMATRLDAVTSNIAAIAAVLVGARFAFSPVGYWASQARKRSFV